LINFKELDELKLGFLFYQKEKYNT